MPIDVERDHLAVLLRPVVESNDGVALLEQFDKYARANATDTSAWEFREVIFELVADFLDADDPQAVRTAARLIRRNMGVYVGDSELDAIVDSLTDIVGGRRTTTASEAALTLGFLLSTRPPDRHLPSWDGSYPGSQQGMKDLDQYRLVPETADGPGYVKQVDDNLVDNAIKALIENVDRKEYKRSANWDVGKACTLSLGFIGYRSPERVANAVPQLVTAVTKDDVDFEAIIYTLSSIGYSRPDLLGGDVIERIESLAENASGDVPWGIKIQAQVGSRKIGHAPSWLGKIGAFPGPNLEAIFERLFKFMLGKFPSYDEEVVRAFLDIVDARSDEAIPILLEELESIVDGNYRTINFPSNLMGILKEVSEVNPSLLQPVAAMSNDLYGDHGMEHYWYDQGSVVLRNVHDVAPDSFPSDHEQALRTFLKDERRASVRRSTKKLLDRFT